MRRNCLAFKCGAVREKARASEEHSSGLSRTAAPPSATKDASPLASSEAEHAAEDNVLVPPFLRASFSTPPALVAAPSPMRTSSRKGLPGSTSAQSRCLCVASQAQSLIESRTADCEQSVSQFSVCETSRFYLSVY